MGLHARTAGVHRVRWSRLPFALRRSHCQARTHAHTHRLVRPPTHTHTHSLTHTHTHTHRLARPHTQSQAHTHAHAHPHRVTRAHPTAHTRTSILRRKAAQRSARACVYPRLARAGGRQRGLLWPGRHGHGLAAATGRCRHGLHRRAQPHPVGRALPADPRRYGRLQIRRAPTVPAPRTSAVRTFAGTRGLCMRTTRARGRQVVTHMQFERSTVGKRMLCLRLAS